MGGGNRTLDEPPEINILVESRIRFGRLESPDRVRTKSPIQSGSGELQLSMFCVDKCARKLKMDQPEDSKTEEK
jgi:hypothetical protein